MQPLQPNKDLFTLMAGSASQVPINTQIWKILNTCLDDGHFYTLELQDKFIYILRFSMSTMSRIKRVLNLETILTCKDMDEEV